MQQLVQNFSIDYWRRREEKSIVSCLPYLQSCPQKQTKQLANLLSSDSKEIVMGSTRLKDKKGVMQYSSYC